MPGASTRCPNCGFSVDAAVAVEGDKLRCPKCRFDFSPQVSVWAPVPGESPSASRAPRPPVDPERLHLRREREGQKCPRCRAENVLDARFCGLCGTDLHAGQPPESMESAPGAGEASGRSRGVLLGLLVAVIVLGTIGLLYYGRPSSRAAAEAAAAPATPAPPARVTQAPAPIEAPPPVARPSVEAAPKAVDEEFYANGKLRARGRMKTLSDGNRVRHGIWTNYWANGSVNAFGSYEDGEQVGTWLFYVDDGSLCITNSYRPPSAARVAIAGAAKAASRQANSTAVPPGRSPAAVSAIPGAGAPPPPSGRPVATNSFSKPSSGTILFGESPSGTVPAGASPTGTRVLDNTESKCITNLPPGSVALRDRRPGEISVEGPMPGVRILTTTETNSIATLPAKVNPLRDLPRQVVPLGTLPPEVKGMPAGLTNAFAKPTGKVVGMEERRDGVVEFGEKARGVKAFVSGETNGFAKPASPAIGFGDRPGGTVRFGESPSGTKRFDGGEEK